MWSWYRTQLQQFGFIEATFLLFRVVVSRIKVILANELLPARVACPCCGWSGRRYYDYIETGYTTRNAACPQCDSHPRHRAFVLWLRNEYRLQAKAGIAVVFAPEESLRPLWESAPDLRIFRVDLEAKRNVDALVDIQLMPLTSDSVDLLWCHHVLEHIEDDFAGIRELNRVLRTDSGELIVSVPMLLGSETKEYGFPNLRESGHWRIYGDDFVDRLTAAGFEVQPGIIKLTEAEASRYGIVSEPFYVCRKP